MVDDCALGAENKTRINGINNNLKEIKESLKSKVSAVFVSVGVFVLACLLGIIYNGQRDISKDITTIKIEQSKVTSEFKLHESKFDQIDEKIDDIRKKTRNK